MTNDKAVSFVRELERITPYMVEGLYGSFLRRYMDCDRTRWTSDLSLYLKQFDPGVADCGDEVAMILWDKFERRISC
ncbi:MAG: hypothetical protein PHS86_03685 [Syntrophaceae bacterium]|nr:hypothetical protein [Syntrophaceae bacterium]